ncbi:hypothetical protein HYU94_03315 [Candidatus Daviesbacteria bacterium]|nr:hypothetical protein [Candidatus Daviesbacteria bacterium]
MYNDSEGRIIKFDAAKERLKRSKGKDVKECPLGRKAFDGLSDDAVKRLEEYYLRAGTKEQIDDIEQLVQEGYPYRLDLEVFDPKKGSDSLLPMDVQMELRALAFRNMANRDSGRGELVKLEAAKLMDKAEEFRNSTPGVK